MPDIASASQNSLTCHGIRLSCSLLQSRALIMLLTTTGRPVIVLCAARRQKPKIKLFRDYFGHWRSHMMIISMETYFYFDPGLFWAWPPVLAALNFILGFGATLSALLHLLAELPTIILFRALARAWILFWALARTGATNFILGVGTAETSFYLV